jgi:hypothetical protein
MATLAVSTTQQRQQQNLDRDTAELWNSNDAKQQKHIFSSMKFMQLLAAAAWVAHGQAACSRSLHITSQHREQVCVCDV